MFTELFMSQLYLKSKQTQRKIRFVVIRDGVGVQEGELNKDCQ